ncbi:MAG TPA: squalene/phytoene synthase family protein [Stellaceae bacterium]|nr:squalene/phytoene synthase family protein [Stellaceae bacterium]
MAEVENPKLSVVAALVRRSDRDRFVTALFAPADRREDLLALYAFNQEVGKVPEIVSEPLLGSIRLQWWRETLDEIYAGGKPRRHEVAEPLARAISRHGLTRAHFDRILDARDAELGSPSPATLAELEDYAEDTSGALMLLALEILGLRDEATAEIGRLAGIGYALAGLLRAAAFQARGGVSHLPRELDPDQAVLTLKSTPELRRAVAKVAQTARGHLHAARSLRGNSKAAALPALLPAVIATRWLDQIESAAFDVFARHAVAPDPWRGWRLSFAVWRGRY